MLSLDQLKILVQKNLKKDGFLDHMRAQLKLQTFKIIDKESKGIKDNAGFQWEHPQLSNLKGMQYGQTCLDLIYEFLDYFRLDYTLDVFKKEVAITQKVQRKTLENEINFRKTPDSSKPVFLNILTDYNHILENGLVAMNSPKMNQSDYSAANLNNFSASYAIDNYTKGKEKTGDQNEFDQSQSQSYDQYEAKKNNWIGEDKDKDDTLDRIEQEENERQEKQLQKEKEEREEREREEKKKKEEEELNKQKGKKKGKLEAPPVVEKKPPPTAVNKIRGGSSKNMNAVSSIYNIGGFGSSNQQKDPYANTGNYGFDMHAANDPYGFDLNADLGPAKDPYAFDLDDAGSKDPYAFDITEGDYDGGFGNKGKKQTNQYDFEFDDKDTFKKKKDDPKKNKFAGSSGLGGPQSYDLEDGYVGVSYKSKNKKQQEQSDDSNEYLDEDIDELQDSNRDYGNYKNKKDNRNPMFTSSEDIFGASQSQYVDQVVQSDVMDSYDYFEPIQKKKK